MSTQEIRKQVAVALEAVNEKKALDVTLLQLPHESSTFTDYFLICSGSNPRQVQAIADEVDERLSKGMHVEPNAREGYNKAEWILLDYVDFVVHIFNAQRRAYYDLERLWKSAHHVTPEELLGKAKPAAVAEIVQTEAVPAEVVPAPAKKAVAKKPVAKKAVAKKAPAKKAASKTVKPAAKKKVAAKKVVAKKAAAKKAVAKKAVVKKAVTKKVAVKKAVTKKVAAKKTVAKKAVKKAAKRK